MEKSAKQLLSEHCQRQKIPHPVYECKPDKEGQPNGFFCTVKIGDKSFTIPEYEKSKKLAERTAAKMTCSKMNITQSSCLGIKKVKSTQKVATIEPHTSAEMSEANMACSQTNITHSSDDTKEVKPIQNVAAIMSQNPPVKAVKDPDWVTIEKVQDLYKYLPDEVLAREFKTFLNCKAQEENRGAPVFMTNKVEGKSFIATVAYDGVTYGSLGSMVTKKLAEQSAAEVCLRTLGDFPNVTKDKYTIQQYHGGRVKRWGKEPGNVLEKPKGPLFRLLCQYANNLKLQHPTLMHKIDSSEEIPLYMVALQFEGKIFQSTTPATAYFTGVEEASLKAMKYLGVADPEEASALKQSIGIRIRNRRTFSMSPFASPLAFSPSKRTGWVFRYLESIDEMTDKEFVIEDDINNILRISPSSTQDANEIFDRAMKVEPRLNGSLLSECGDIVVAEVNKSNRSNTIVGNQNFSIQMFAENGKILSTKKGSLVGLSPGQNIRGLKCSYQLKYPSLQVYLKAESCTEVTKPRKPLPVVTSCGVAMLIYDHEAHIKDLNILLTRPSGKQTFVSRSNFLKSYLNGAITSANTSTFTVTECVKNITTWTEREVQLMSEMTVESMKQLLSVSVRYDERWSELFGEKQTDVLKELKGAALAELSRRKTAGVMDVEEEEEWRLPMTAFQHTLNNSGVYMEDNVRCAFRSAAQITGTKVKLGDLEESKIVDVPVNSANKGAVCRYYVWKGIRKVSGNEHDPYYDAPTDVTAELGEGWVVTGMSTKSTKSGVRKRVHNPLSHKRRRYRDNDTDNGVSEAKKGNTELNEDITDLKPADEEEVPIKPGVTSDDDITDLKPADEEEKVPMKPGVTSSNKPIFMECRWVPLEEAKKICPILKTIANQTPFKDQVVALQHDANNFWKEIQDKQEGV